MSGDDPDHTSRHPWIELREGKQWSRLLYTNPVCFLATTAMPQAVLPREDEDEDDTAASNRKNPDATTTESDPAPVDEDGDSKPSASWPPPQPQPKPTPTANEVLLRKNVMILSWLTPVNNHGTCVFSLNRSRSSASRVLQSQQFTLSVPTREQQQLVLDVGSVSGSHGISKFPQDHGVQHANEGGTLAPSPSTNPSSSNQPRTASPHRKRPKARLPKFPLGIPGLRAVQLGTTDDATTDNGSNAPFAIGGTVAHLQCRLITTTMTTPPPMVVVDDAQHLLLTAQVEKAWVRIDYWDTRRNLFRPQNYATSPYLTFFGSQTFGYVVGEDCLQELEEYQGRRNDAQISN